jgi:formate hydrogenlyase subunit 6/NADH:ubiquinone oxidoreductase subunit I
MCEAYCPTDALYVAPEADELTGVRESDLAEGIMGDYRKKVFKYDAVRRSQTSRTIG